MSSSWIAGVMWRSGDGSPAYGFYTVVLKVGGWDPLDGIS